MTTSTHSHKAWTDKGGHVTAAAGRTFAAMMTMHKIDIAAIEAARRG